MSEQDFKALEEQYLKEKAARELIFAAKAAAFIDNAREALLALSELERQTLIAEFPQQSKANGATCATKQRKAPPDWGPTIDGESMF